MSPDPSPPPPPPPPPPPAEDLDAYLGVLRAAGETGEGAREDTAQRVGGWRFCYVSPAPGVRRSSMAVHPEHPPVRADQPSDWWNLLTETGMDAGRAHRLVAWLMERPAPIEPGRPRMDRPEADAVVTPPSLDVEGDRAALRGWVVWPPNMGEPFLVSVEARRGTPASPTSTRWDRLGS